MHPARSAYWKDGRNVPDVMAGVMQYPKTPEHPEFQVMLRVDFISGNSESGGTQFIGSEGVLTLEGDGYTIRHHKMSKAPGYRWLGCTWKLIQNKCRKN